MADTVDDEAELFEWASRSIWNVMFNQQVVDSIRHIKNAQKNVELLTHQALNMPTYNLEHDISYVTVRFR